jgi:hypothetical protein
MQYECFLAIPTVRHDDSLTLGQSRFHTSDMANHG